MCNQFVRFDKKYWLHVCNREQGYDMDSSFHWYPLQISAPSLWTIHFKTELIFYKCTTCAPTFSKVIWGQYFTIILIHNLVFRLFFGWSISSHIFPFLKKILNLLPFSVQFPLFIFWPSSSCFPTISHFNTILEGSPESLPSCILVLELLREVVFGLL